MLMLLLENLLWKMSQRQRVANFIVQTADVQSGRGPSPYGLLPTQCGKYGKEFETFLENKQISKIRKKHLGDQIVINSYVYMFFNCDQSWIKSYLLCYFWRQFPIILETKHNWKSSLGDQPPRFSNLAAYSDPRPIHTCHSLIEVSIFNGLNFDLWQVCIPRPRVSIYRGVSILPAFTLID